MNPKNQRAMPYVSRRRYENDVNHEKHVADMLGTRLDEMTESRNYWMKRALDAELAVTLVLSDSDALGRKS